MGEKIMSPTEQFAFMFKIIMTLLTIIILLSLFMSLKPLVETKNLIRINVEIADNILRSDIARNALLDSRELSSGLERPVRHCSIGYTATVKTRNDEWTFGYKNVFTEGQYVTQSYPVGVIKNGIEPAVLTITVYDTLLTRVSCAIEKAYKLADVQSLKIPCTYLVTEEGSEVPDFRDCVFAAYKKQDLAENKFICMRTKQTAFGVPQTECRYLPDVSFENAYLTYRENVLLKAYPVRAGSRDCAALRASPLPLPGEVETVVLCVE